MIIERVPDPEPPPPGKGQGGQKRPSRRRSRAEVPPADFSAVPASTAAKLQRRLGEAAAAFEAERFTDVEKMLASIERLAPGVPEVIELWGLTSYRLGRWRRAANQLERFAELTGSVEQHPVRADCYRALRQWAKAEELWEELGAASPAPELIEEGRIVHAGTLADRGRLLDAIRVLEKAPRPPRRPAVHHLRRWYALADLYERSGELGRARRVFTDILEADPSFGDVPERLTNLG